MAKFQVKYFYLATGMEGRPDIKDYGIREADTSKEAINQVVMEEFPDNKNMEPDELNSNRRFLRGCLSAKPIT